ncbi:MAG: alpha/beta hydrolase, partial [Romboutsia sp.]|nr:alpha/beta hydrolase [Romboutsia sp.]
LYMHGNAGSLRDWGWIYKDFVARGYDILLIDYRTYGKSTGKLSEKNMHSDVTFIYDELKKDYQENQIIIYGRSIGTGMATHIASIRKPKGLVLETPYYSIIDIAKRIVPFLFLEPLLKYKFKSFKFLKTVECPIYFLHGTNDNVVP